MAKFAFIVPPLTGHVNPTLSIGAALLERGHEAAWISLDPTLEANLPEGGKLLLIQYDQTDAEKKESEQYLDIISKKVVYGIDSVKFLYEEVLIPLNRHCYPGIVALLKTYQPDLIIGDHQLFAAPVAAENLGIPYATSVTAPAAVKIMNELPKVHEWEVNQIIGLQKELGFHEERSLATSELLTLVLTSGYFFGEMEDLPSQYKFTGPVLTERRISCEFDWDRLKNASNKKILVSIGTTFDHDHKKAFFQKVVDAFKDEDVTVVVVSDPQLFERWPDNFMVYRQVPQLDLLPHLDGVVCHGGHNTVSETLSNGIPLVVIPIAYDQSHVAGRVVRTEAGERLNFNRFKANHLREAVQQILNNPGYREAAQKVGQSFAEAGGTATAASLLEQAISKASKPEKPSKFLFVVPPFFGHVSPTLSVGASLIARGHEVKWFGITPLDSKHIPEGGSYFYPEEDLIPYQEEIARILKRQDDGPACSGPEVMKLALEETYVPFAKMMMPGLTRLTEHWMPDVIVNDCISFGGALFAHKHHIPCVTTTPVPPDVMGDTEKSAPKIWEWQQNLIKDLQKEVGIHEEGIYIHSHKLNMVFTSQAFAGFDTVPSHMKFVGPVKGRPNDAPFDWDKLNASTTPKIFVSLGTLLVDIRKAFFEKIIAAFADQPVTIVAATPPEIFEEWPDNFIVNSFVPQSAVMQQMDMVICHGGFNTVNDTFRNGLPMLITPIAYDHFHIAKLIEQAGCGISIRYKRLRVEALRETVFELLENPGYREAAREVRNTFTLAGGNDKAVELLENFVHEHSTPVSIS
ncbi:glycosyltransferase [Chryseobacterium flavum]|uniref:glycosyltransferase n=1 Tax=Chryseobacterium flavum TaxID=415851 RepID=UPI0028A8BDD1|nr:nucleotide disphospho-sugar-binding domain-containing protein [Chryseobacterium flavum]